MNKRFRLPHCTFRLSALLGAGLIVLMATSTAAAQLQFFVLRNDNVMFRHNTSLPTAVIDDIPISGMKEVGELIDGIDFRPVDGVIYGVSNRNRLYKIDPVSGVATQVGAATFPIELTEKHGFDFNPTVDRIRVLDGPTRNIRLNPDTAAQLVDTPLTYAAGDGLFGQPVTINAIAYSNNAPGSATTTLFGIDHNFDVLVRIGGVDGNPSPNTGLVSSIGPLGVNAGADTHFDIGASNLAFATIDVLGNPSLFTVNLSTGAASLIGATAIAATQTGLALAPVGQFEFNAATETVSEQALVATVTVLRKGGAFGNVTVNYATGNGTAIEPGDYTAKTGTLTFDVGETSKAITVPVIDDTTDEADEVFTVTLSAPGGGATLGTLITSSVTIVDNDPTPSIIPGVNCGNGACGVGAMTMLPLAFIALGYRRRRSRR